MKVILTQDIKGVGKKDEIINANDGYARNFLLPRKMAVEANSQNMSLLQGRKDSANFKKEQEKENSYFHVTMNVEVYLNWCTLHQSSVTQNKNTAF